MKTRRTKTRRGKGGGPKNHEVIGDWVVHSLILREDFYHGRARNTVTGETKYHATRKRDPEDAGKEVRRWIRRLETEAEGKRRAEKEGREAQPAGRRFDAAFEEWLSLKTCRKNTLRAYWKDYAGGMPEDGHTTKYGNPRRAEGVYKPEFGSCMLDEIRRKDIILFKKKLSDGKRSIRTIQKHLICLRSFFEWCLDEDQGYIRRNPCRKVTAGRGKGRKPVPLEREEAKRLLEAARTSRIMRVKAGTKEKKPGEVPHLWLALLIGFHSGLRQSNILGLRWGDLDLVKRRLFIEGARMKSGEDFALPLHPELVEVLAAQLKARRKVPAAHEHVLGFEISEMKHSFKSALRRAGLPDSTRWHDTTRHSFASWLGEEKASFAVVRDCLGHAGGTVTDRYAHARWRKQVEAIEALPRLLGNVEEAARKAE